MMFIKIKTKKTTTVTKPFLWWYRTMTTVIEYEKEIEIPDEPKSECIPKPKKKKTKKKSKPNTDGMHLDDMEKNYEKLAKNPKEIETFNNLEDDS